MKTLIAELNTAFATPTQPHTIIGDIFNGLDALTSIAAVANVCQVVVGQDPEATVLSDNAVATITAILDNQDAGWETPYGEFVMDELAELVTDEVREDAFVRIALKKANEKETETLTELLDKLQTCNPEDAESAYVAIEEEYAHIFTKIAKSPEVAIMIKERVQAWRVAAVAKAEEAKLQDAKLEEASASLIGDNVPVNNPANDDVPVDNVVQLNPPKQDTEGDDDLLA